MSTTLYFRAVTPDWSRGQGDANLAGGTQYWVPRALATSRGAAATTAIAVSVLGTTLGLEAGGNLEWISDPLDTDIVLNSTATLNLWGLESSMNANASLAAIVQRIDSQGAVQQTVLQGLAGSAELGTSAAVQNGSIGETNTQFFKGDRLRVRVYFDDAPATTMASGFSLTFGYDGPTAAANGDSYIQFTETFGFLTTAPSGSVLYLTNTSSDIDPNGASYDSLEAWTSRGSTAQTRQTTLPSAGPVAPVLATAGAGANFIEWFTPQLTGFTLSGLIAANIGAREIGTTTNAAVRCEVAICGSDGTSPVIWGAANDSVELGTAEAAMTFNIAGDDTSVTDGQRLRIRVYWDDAPGVAIAAAGATQLYYSGPTAAASGDTYITLPQTVTQFVSSTPITASDTAVGADVATVGKSAFNNFEGGTDATALTTANSGGASGTAFDLTVGGANARLWYEADAALDGSMGYLSSGEAGGANQGRIGWTSAVVGSGTSGYWRFYWKRPVMNESSPGMNVYQNTNGTTKLLDVRVDADGTVNLRSGGGTVVDSTTAGFVTLGTWMRVEIFHDVVPDTATVRLFKGANLHGLTPDDTLTGTVTAGTAIGSATWGNDTGGSTLREHFDAIAFSGSDWIGPGSPSIRANEFGDVSDIASVTVPVAVGDSATAVESIPTFLTATTDTATAVDTAPILGMTVADTAVATDTAPTLGKTVTDAATASDTAPILGMTVADAATGVDTAPTLGKTVTDAAVGTESIPTFSMATTDAGVAADTSQLQAGNLLTANDAATATESIPTLAKEVTDTATGSDTAVVDAGAVDKVASDTGSAADTSALTTGGVTATDTAVGTDTASVDTGAPPGGADLIFTAGTPAFSTASVTTLNVALPSGLVAGDYTILVCALNVSSGAISPPAGWSDILANTNTTTGSTSGHHAIYYRKWVSGDTDPVAVTCASGRIAVLPVRVQNADPATFIEVAASVTQDPTADTSVTAPTITSTASTKMCYTLMGRNAGVGVFVTWTPAGGDTEVGEVGSQAAAATNAATSFNTSTITPGTPSGPRTGTASATITGGMGVSFALTAATAPTTPITASDSGTASDTSVLVAALPATDAATATDSIPTLAKATTDVATGTDISQLQAGGLLTANDSATASDGAILTAALGRTDAGTATDTASVVAAITATVTSPLPSLTQAVAAVSITAVAPVFDSFNRADAAIGTSTSGHTWIAQSGTWNISTNRVYRATSEMQSTVVIDSGFTTCSLTVDATFPAVLNDAGVVFAATDDNNYLLLVFEASSPTLFELRLWKRSAGTFTLLAGPYAVPNYANSTKRARVEWDAANGEIEIWFDYVQVTTVTLGSTDRALYAAGTRQGLRENAVPSGDKTYFDNYSLTPPTLPALSTLVMARSAITTGWSDPASDTTMAGAGTQVIVVTAGV